MLEPEWVGKVNRTQLAVRRTNTLASSHPEAVLLACGMGIFWHDATQTAARGSKSAFIYVCTRCVRIIGRSLRLGVWSLSDWRWEPAEWILMVSSWACDCHLNTHINQHKPAWMAFQSFPVLHSTSTPSPYFQALSAFRSNWHSYQQAHIMFLFHICMSKELCLVCCMISIMDCLLGEDNNCGSNKYKS